MYFLYSVFVVCHLFSVIDCLSGSLQKFLYMSKASLYDGGSVSVSACLSLCLSVPKFHNVMTYKPFDLQGFQLAWCVVVQQGGVPLVYMNG